MLGGGKESHVAEVGGSGGEAAVWFRPGRGRDDETVALQGAVAVAWLSPPPPRFGRWGGGGSVRIWRRQVVRVQIWQQQVTGARIRRRRVTGAWIRRQWVAAARIRWRRVTMVGIWQQRLPPGYGFPLAYILLHSGKGDGWRMVRDRSDRGEDEGR